MLSIKNYENIIGCYVESKWVPDVKNFIVRDIEETNNAYLIRIGDQKNSSINYQINIERSLIGDNYEVWGWGINGKPQRYMTTKTGINTIKRTIGIFCLVLSKMIK